jgi:hypothetical protein
MPIVTLTLATVLTKCKGLICKYSGHDKIANSLERLSGSREARAAGPGDSGNQRVYETTTDGFRATYSGALTRCTLTLAVTIAGPASEIRKS